MSDRHRRPTYWLARIALNGVSMGMFRIALEVIGLEFSWTLYWCTFGVYVTLSLGDTLLDEVWPVKKNERT